ncbi:polysaccharide deacetylase family protein [Mesorhizobium sp. SP-1A]|uniref:polysaccharide deacetylase family protein n=1 Tax=Mesorhizobium sp. SP-1A TaxID=3077840 RepID=UPI0028F6DE61|nr:polysaccharide deacetylase family protein [Mesorhizobium sp. SP-1A]
MRLLASLLAATLLCVGPALAGQKGLVEPSLHVAPGGTAGPRVALTFDACMGRTDMRILSALIDNKVPATVFVTSRWLRHNAPALAMLQAHPDLFEIENHGAMHVPAVDHPATIYGIAAAGSPAAVDAEVEGGAAAIRAAGAADPHWFRGSTALYSPSAIEQIRKLGFRIAGYSVNGDGGSLLGAGMAQKRIASARDGDVVISHINQPTHSAGEGVVKGILALKAKGFAFVRLSDVEVDGSDGTTATLSAVN